MRTILAAFLIILPVCPALAQGQANATTMSCAEATALLKERGAVVFDTGGGDFSRFVVDEGQCEENQMTEPAWIPTRDQPQCLVGRRCIEIPSHSK